MENQTKQIGKFTQMVQKYPSATVAGVFISTFLLSMALNLFLIRSSNNNYKELYEKADLETKKKDQQLQELQTELLRTAGLIQQTNNTMKRADTALVSAPIEVQTFKKKKR